MQIKITATLPTFPKSNARNYADKNEIIESYIVIAYVPNYLPESNFKELIACQVCMDREKNSFSTVYASIWIRGDSMQTSGTGSSSTWEKNKVILAIAEAIESAGVRLDQDIGRRGGHGIIEALTAIAQAMGYTDIHIIN